MSTRSISTLGVFLLSSILAAGCTGSGSLHVKKLKEKTEQTPPAAPAEAPAPGAEGPREPSTRSDLQNQVLQLLGSLPIGAEQAEVIKNNLHKYSKEFLLGAVVVMQNAALIREESTREQIFDQVIDLFLNGEENAQLLHAVVALDQRIRQITESQPSQTDILSALFQGQTGGESDQTNQGQNGSSTSVVSTEPETPPLRVSQVSVDALRPSLTTVSLSVRSSAATHFQYKVAPSSSANSNCQDFNSYGNLVDISSTPSVDVSGLSDGSLVLCLLGRKTGVSRRAVDVSEYSWVKDTTPPTTAVSTGPAARFQSAGASVVFEVTRESADDVLLAALVGQNASCASANLSGMAGRTV